MRITIESATAYALEHLTGLGYEPALGEIEKKKVDGVEMVLIKFTLEGEDGAPWHCIFDVWIENGKIYGEW